MQWLQNKHTNFYTLIFFITLISGFAFFAVEPQEAQAISSATVARVAGTDRYTTAIEASKLLYPTADSANSVVLASGENFPDALAATPLAYKVNGPLLLVHPSYVSSTVLNEIKRALPNSATVYIVGGTSAVSNTVKSSIEAQGFTVQRIAGATDRISTSVAVANVLAPADPESVFIVNNNSYADAVSASSPAALRQYPILLNPQDTLNGHVRSYLNSRSINTIYLIGGTGALSQALQDYIETQYPSATVTRIAGGVDRYGTSASIASTFFTGSTASKLTFANGLRFPDGLVGGLVAARRSGPLLLVQEGFVPRDILDFVVSRASIVTRGYIIGGTGVISFANALEITNLLQTGHESNTVVAVGDIACNPGSGSYNSGNGTSTACRQFHTANLAEALSPDYAFVLGDLQYEAGELSNFNVSYENSWGSMKSITYPSPGNHEYYTTDAEGYYDYFNGVGVETGRAGDRDEGWYSVDIDNWHIISLNSNCGDVECGAGSAQVNWLQTDLANNTKPCTLAFWHHPRFSSGEHGSSSDTATFWHYLDSEGAELVLQGHDHNYERFAKMDSAGAATDSGMRSFVVGTGGKSLREFGTTAANSVVRLNDDFGVLKLELYDWGYEWEFLNESQEILDSGSDVCS